MTFQDIFKSNFLENVSSVSLLDMGISLALAFALGVFIFWIYKLTYKGVMYSSSFGLALIALTLVTNLVILAVTSNIVLSLGMVGALSIVRFRAAIKDPMDIVFLFWSLAAGIVLAAGLLPLAVFGSALIGLVIYVFANRKTHTNPYILLLRCANDAAERAAQQMLTERAKVVSLKSKTVSAEQIEVHYEIRLKDESTAFVNALSAIDGVQSAVLVTYNGEYMG